MNDSASTCELTYPDVQMYLNDHSGNGSLPSSAWLELYTDCAPQHLLAYKIKSLCFVGVYTVLLAMYSKSFLARLIRYALPSLPPC
jgi:hypothetical protein